MGCVVAIRKLYLDDTDDNVSLELGPYPSDTVCISIDDLNGGRPGRSIELTADDAEALARDLLAVVKQIRKSEARHAG